MANTISLSVLGCDSLILHYREGPHLPCTCCNCELDLLLLIIIILLLLVLNPLWDIGHQQCLFATVCGFWLLILALANFSQALLSPSQLLFSKSGTVHQQTLPKSSNGFHSIAMRAILSVSLRRVWSIQAHFCLLIRISTG